MGGRGAKDALYEAFAEVAKAMASGRRAEIVDVLAQGERSVEEIAAEIDQSVANTSHHLRQLSVAGLVTGTKRGRFVVYALVPEVYQRQAEEAAGAANGQAPETPTRDVLDFGCCQLDLGKRAAAGKAGRRPKGKASST